MERPDSSSQSKRKRAANELKREIERLQTALFGTALDSKELLKINIQLERVIDEYEKTEDYRAERAEMEAALERKDWEVNQAALAKLRQEFGSAPDRFRRVEEEPVLRLLLYSTDVPITSFLSYEYPRYVGKISGLTLEETRALRAWLPPPEARDPHQAGWVRDLDFKISQMEKSGVAAPRRSYWKKPTERRKLPLPGFDPVELIDSADRRVDAVMRSLDESSARSLKKIDRTHPFFLLVSWLKFIARIQAPMFPKEAEALTDSIRTTVLPATRASMDSEHRTDLQEQDHAARTRRLWAECAAVVHQRCCDAVFGRITKQKLV